MDFVTYLKQQTYINKKHIDDFVKVLSTYEENDIMYVEALEDIFEPKEREVLIPKLEDEGYLDKVYIVQCPYCDNLGNTYVEYDDIPIELDSCRYCETEFSASENYTEAYRIKFNYNDNTDVIAEINDKIDYNKSRLEEIALEMKELEIKRHAIQSENINLITSKNRMLALQQNSKTYEKIINEHPKAQYIGISDGPNIYAKCSQCNKEFEIYMIGNRKIIGVCPDCEMEVDFTGYQLQDR